MSNRDAMNAQERDNLQVSPSRRGGTGSPSASTPRQPCLGKGIKAAIHAGELADEVRWLLANAAACREVVAAESDAGEIFREVERERRRIALHCISDEDGAF
ncbi:MAG: hypothetical protein K6E40_12065 [Desulfovibrio sp.]|nr:hypothetical protein [Desulfovibrio sp.]